MASHRLEHKEFELKTRTSRGPRASKQLGWFDSGVGILGASGDMFNSKQPDLSDIEWRVEWELGRADLKRKIERQLKQLNQADKLTETYGKFQEFVDFQAQNLGINPPKVDTKDDFANNFFEFFGVTTGNDKFLPGDNIFNKFQMFSDYIANRDGINTISINDKNEFLNDFFGPTLENNSYVSVDLFSEFFNQIFKTY